MDLLDLQAPRCSSPNLFSYSSLIESKKIINYLPFLLPRRDITGDSSSTPSPYKTRRVSSRSFQHSQGQVHTTEEELLLCICARHYAISLCTLKSGLSEGKDIHSWKFLCRLSFLLYLAPLSICFWLLVYLALQGWASSKYDFHPSLAAQKRKACAQSMRGVL